MRLAFTAAGIVVVTLILASCRPGPLPASAEARPTQKANYTAAPPTPTLAPIRTPSFEGHGRPYTADDIVTILEAGPPAFPDELRDPALTRVVAEAIASTIETYDGQPYRNLFVQGSCDEGGIQRCDVTVSCLPGFATTRDEQDTYRFEVRDGIVSAQREPQRRGLPIGLTAELDAAARRLAVDGLLEGRSLLAIEWSPAPPADAYLLFYGDGDEEGDSTVIVRIDRSRELILDFDMRNG